MSTLGIKLIMSTAFHQNTNGQAERAIKTVSQILCNYIDPRQSSWSKNLWRAEAAINLSPVRWIGRSPLEIAFGHAPRELPGWKDKVNPSKNPAVDAYIHQQQLDNKVAADALLVARYRERNSVAKRRRAPQQYFPGDMVFYHRLGKT